MARNERPEETTGSPPSPDLFFSTMMGHQLTAVMRTALELDLFTLIGAGTNTAATIAKKTGGAERGVRILCDALATLGHLTRDDDGSYALTNDSAAFLDRHSPVYLGSAADFIASPLLDQAFDRLTEAVRKGGTVLPDDPAMAPDSPYWVSFARNMGPMQRFPAQALAELLDPKPGAALKVLDIAAGHGHFGIAMATRNPNAEIYALDWPQVLEVAKENAARAGVASRYHTMPGSAFEVELGSNFDWVLLPNFLHHFDPPTCETLLRRVRAALAPEGEAAVLEFVVDENRTAPMRSAMFALIMLTTTPAGDAYSYSELAAMFDKAGFSETELHPLPPSFQRVVIATP
ncbi:MAG TPA: class I SAM-dependent methyltransferase [Terriglobales bacterium]|nr:class I SAM-dependent methyltransferase [Terriglobales bacterium]